MNCPICTADNEEILWRNDKLRVIAVHNEANAPAFCRVIWQNHVAEMTDLDAAERAELMETVYRVESAWATSYRTCTGTLSLALPTMPISPPRFGRRRKGRPQPCCLPIGRSR